MYSLYTRYMVMVLFVHYKMEISKEWKTMSERNPFFPILKEKNSWICTKSVTISFGYKKNGYFICVTKW